MADESTRRIDLPGGHWAVRRDPATVTRRQRRPVEDAMGDVRGEIINLIAAANEKLEKARQVGDDEAIAVAQTAQRRATDQLTRAERASLRDANEAAIVALLESWSFDGPITLDAVLDLPGPVGDALQAAVAPLTAAMFLNTTPDPMNPNPTAPGGGSPESETPSTAAP